MSISTHSGIGPASRGQCEAIDLTGKIALIDGYWQPRVVAEMNDYQFKVVKVEGEFVWHKHSDTDETFIVLDGELRIDFRDGPSGDGSLVLRAGQMAMCPQVAPAMFCETRIQQELYSSCLPRRSHGNCTFTRPYSSV